MICCNIVCNILSKTMNTFCVNKHNLGCFWLLDMLYCISSVMTSVSLESSNFLTAAVFHTFTYLLWKAYRYSKCWYCSKRMVSKFVVSVQSTDIFAKHIKNKWTYFICKFHLLCLYFVSDFSQVCSFGHAGTIVIILFFSSLIFCLLDWQHKSYLITKTYEMNPS